MINLTTSEIDLVTIIDPDKNLLFDVDEIEHLAQSIAKVGALTRIPIVKRSGIENFQLVEGVFEYFAFLRARELNSALPDRMRVFIIPPRSEELVQEQIDAIRRIETPINQPITPNDRDDKNLEIKIANHIDHLGNRINEMLRGISEEISSKLKGHSSSAIFEKLLQIEEKLSIFEKELLFTNDKINLKTANKNLLKKVPSIGEKTADKIIRWREEIDESISNLDEALEDLINKGILNRKKVQENLVKRHLSFD